MAFKKQKKSLEKVIAKSIPPKLVTPHEDGMLVVVDGRDRATFRVIRDHFQGKIAADINYVYGLLGTVKVSVSDDEIVVICLNQHDRLYASHRLRVEEETA